VYQSVPLAPVRLWERVEAERVLSCDGIVQYKVSVVGECIQAADRAVRVIICTNRCHENQRENRLSHEN
jgi:hypothetical protein